MSAATDAGGLTRDKLAITIVSLSVVGIAAAAALAIFLSTNQQRSETTRLVFSSVLPLFGTWVGTVLAFYFARENLQAATDSTVRLSRRPELQTPVQQVMIPLSRIVAHGLPAGNDGTAVKLNDLGSEMRTNDVHRIVVMTSTHAALYVVHDSTIARLANQLQKDPSDAASFTETMADLLAVSELEATVLAVGIVGPESVIADARAAMRAVPGCNDVFVTLDGGRESPVLGWLTNTDMAGSD